MMDCKSMTTPMITNLKKPGALESTLVESTLVDPIMHKKLIGLLMYLVNTRSNIGFVVNT
jgi:hypothetical protein